MLRYKARFSYNYYQFVHFHSEKIFVADNLEEAQALADEYIQTYRQRYAQGESKLDIPFLRSLTEIINK